MPKLVLADDSTTMQKVVKLAFAGEDFEVVTFGNGASALEFLRSHGADFVLADSSLPLVDGYELCREIKQDPRTAMIPVLLLAGTFEVFDFERARNAGYDGSLVKPFETSALVGLVQRLLADKISPTSGKAPGKEVPAKQQAWPGEGPFAVPIRSAAGKVLFSLTKEQCRSSVYPVPKAREQREKPDVREVPVLTEEELDYVVNKVIERLPPILKAMVPELIREVKKTSSAG